MASHRDFEYWTKKGMFVSFDRHGIYVTKQSWRRCDILNGLRGDDRLRTADRAGTVYKQGHVYQRNFTANLRFTREDQMASDINTEKKKLIIVESVAIKPKKMTAYRKATHVDLRALQYWTEKGMMSRDMPLRLNKTSWRRCDKLNGLRGGDRIEAKAYMQKTAAGRDFIYDRYFIKVLCPQFRIIQDDADIIEAY